MAHQLNQGYKWHSQKPPCYSIITAYDAIYRQRKMLECSLTYCIKRCTYNTVLEKCLCYLKLGKWHSNTCVGSLCAIKAVTVCCNIMNKSLLINFSLETELQGLSEYKKVPAGNVIIKQPVKCTTAAAPKPQWSLPVYVSSSCHDDVMYIHSLAIHASITTDTSNLLHWDVHGMIATGGCMWCWIWPVSYGWLVIF